jgi:hypothetical protein
MIAFRTKTLFLVFVLISPAALKANDDEVKHATLPYLSRQDLHPAVSESSGLTYWKGRLWSHNDSSGSDSIYAFKVDDPMNILAYCTGVPNKDWEAIEQDEKYIYMGDFGNNAHGNRHDLRIFRIEKNTLLQGRPQADTIFFEYSDQIDFTEHVQQNTNFDCEAFVVSQDSIYLFTKQWLSKRTALYRLPKTPGKHIAVFQDEFDVDGLVTDAEYISSKQILALSGYSSTYFRQFIHVFYDFEDRNFFKGKKYNFALDMGIIPHQVEGLASANGGVYFVTNEFQSVSPQRLHIFDATPYLKDYLARPETPQRISGPKNMCKNGDAYTYIVEAVENADSYIWELPEGFTGQSNTNSITIRPAQNASSGNIYARGANSYGKGGRTALFVAVNDKPPKPHISLDRENPNKLVSNSSKGNQWYDKNGLLKGAVSQYFAPADFGKYYVIVTLNGCSSDPSDLFDYMTMSLLDINYSPRFDLKALYPDMDSLKKQIEKSKKKRKKFLFWEW